MPSKSSKPLSLDHGANSRPSTRNILLKGPAIPPGVARKPHKRALYWCKAICTILAPVLLILAIGLFNMPYEYRSAERKKQLAEKAEENKQVREQKRAQVRLAQLKDNLEKTKRDAEKIREKMEELSNHADNLIFKQAFQTMEEEQFLKFLSAKGERSFLNLGQSNGPILTMIYADGCSFCHEMAADLAPPGFQVRLPQTPVTKNTTENATTSSENATADSAERVVDDKNSTEKSMEAVVAETAVVEDLPEQEKRTELAGVPFFVLNSYKLSNDFLEQYGLEGYPALIAWTYHAPVPREDANSTNATDPLDPDNTGLYVPHFVEKSFARRATEQRLKHWLKGRAMETRMDNTLLAVMEKERMDYDLYQQAQHQQGGAPAADANGAAVVADDGTVVPQEPPTAIPNMFAELSDFGRKVLMDDLALPIVKTRQEVFEHAAAAPLNDLGNARISFVVTPALLDVLVKTLEIFPKRDAKGFIKGAGVAPIWRVLVEDKAGSVLPLVEHLKEDKDEDKSKKEGEDVVVDGKVVADAPKDGKEGEGEVKEEGVKEGENKEVKQKPVPENALGIARVVTNVPVADMGMQDDPIIEATVEFIDEAHATEWLRHAFVRMGVPR